MVVETLGAVFCIWNNGDDGRIYTLSQVGTYVNLENFDAAKIPKILLYR